MSTLQCDILIIERELYSGEVDHVVLPAESGEMGVYQNHQPMIVMLKPGIVRIVEKDGSDPIQVLVNDGYASVGKRGVRILCVRAESVKRIAELDKQQLRVKNDDMKEKLAEMAEDDPNAEYLRDEIEWNEILLDYK